jgi:hypothetical protein
MINQLKQNMLNNQMQGTAGGVQPMPEMPPQNPHYATIQGLQRQKANLQKQYDEASPASPMLTNAAQAVMSTQPGESPIAVLAKGLMGAGAGMKQHNLDQQSNLKQQAEIDQSIANTYQFIKDYDYNRQVTERKLGMQQEELDLKRMDITGKYGAEAAKLRNENRKDVGKESEELMKTYETSEEVVRRINRINQKLAKMKDWGAFTGAMAGENTIAHSLGGNSIADLNVLNKEFNELVLEYGKSFGSNIRVTDNIMELIKNSKPGLALGSQAVKEVLAGMYQSAELKVNRSEFALDNLNRGVPSQISLRAYDQYLQHQDKFDSPQPLVNHYMETGQFPKLETKEQMEARRLREMERDRKETEHTSGVIMPGSYTQNTGAYSPNKSNPNEIRLTRDETPEDFESAVQNAAQRIMR